MVSTKSAKGTKRSGPAKKTKGSEVLGKLEEERARKKKKAAARGTGVDGPKTQTGRKGAEKPEDEEQVEEENERVAGKAENAKVARQEGHISSTAQRRIGGDIASRGRIRQARRDSKNPS